MPFIIFKPVAPASAKPSRERFTTLAQVRASATYARLMSRLAIDRRVRPLLDTEFQATDFVDTQFGDMS